MTDLPSTTELAVTPTLDLPVVRASHRRYGPSGLPRPAGNRHRRWPVGSPRPGPVPVRARRGTGLLVAVAAADAMLALFLVGYNALGPLFPSDLVGPESAPRSTTPALIRPMSAGDFVAADVPPPGRLGGSRDGGAPPPGVTASTTATTVVPDAAPTRGQTHVPGPVGGPASTTTVASVAPTLPPAPPEDSVPPPVPETSVPDVSTPETAPSTIPEETTP